MQKRKFDYLLKKRKEFPGILLEALLSPSIEYVNEYKTGCKTRIQKNSKKNLNNEPNGTKHIFWGNHSPGTSTSCTASFEITRIFTMAISIWNKSQNNFCLHQALRHHRSNWVWNSPFDTIEILYRWYHRARIGRQRFLGLHRQLNPWFQWNCSKK